MSDDERIQQLEATVHHLQMETRILRELMQQQVSVNNITFKGKYDEVIIRMAKEYEALGLEDGDNRELHETLRRYLGDRDEDGE